MPISPIIDPGPQSIRDGFYATNNPYQLNGAQGFTELTYMEETNDLYVRLDFPGITEESVVTLLEPSRKAVTVTGDAPKENKHDSSYRKYGAATGLSCDCCEISNTQSFVEDGVVRLILSKKKIHLHAPPSSCSGARMPTAIAIPSDVEGGHPIADDRYGLDPEDPAFIIVPHPLVLEGSTSAYESKQLPNGGLFLRIDMPGVPNDSFIVVVDGDGGVTVMGRAPATMYDSSERIYRGKVAIVPKGYDGGRIKLIPKLGVVRLIIPP